MDRAVLRITIVGQKEANYMNVVTLQIVVGMDPMGDIEISWYEAASGASPANDSQKRWVWRHSPDGCTSRRLVLVEGLSFSCRTQAQHSISAK